MLNSYDKLVVNVSSEAGSITGCYKDSQPGYCMSKAAMNMQACIALNAIKGLGGAVLNLHPGWVQSVIGSTPSSTAAGFIRILDEPERFSSDKPGFVNYRGDVMKY